MQFMRNNGFDKVYNLLMGFDSWKDLQYPIEK